MALFDQSMFNPQAFSGLLGGLLQGLQFPQPQPSQGFPSLQPQTTELSAQSVQPPAQYAPPPMPSALQPPPGGNLGAGLSGFANARGFLPAISNLVTGLTTGQRTDPSGMAQQSAQATYQALRAAGVPEGAAQAGALNPDVLKTIAPQIYQKPELKDTGTNPFTGQKNLQIWDPIRQTLTPVGANGANTNALGPTEKAMEAGIGGKEFLDVLRNDKNYGPQEANIIQKMISGDIAPPSSFALAKPAWATRIAFASQIDPSFSAATWTSRFAMSRDASTGTVAKTNNALNTGIGHIMQLADAVQNLGNTNFTPANWVKNVVGPMFGGTGVTNFEAIKNRVAPEITRIWRGAGGAEADIKRDLDNLSTANTPEQLYGAISQIAGLMESKIQANQKQYSDAMGPNGRNPDFMIAPENRAAVEKIRALAAGQTPTQASSPAPQTAINPKTGERIMLDPKTNQWVPYK